LQPQLQATATEGPVAGGPVRSSPGFFSGPATGPGNTKPNQSFKDHLSIFSPLAEPSTNILIAESSSFNTSRESDTTVLCFDDLETPQTLEAVLRIKEVRMDVDLEEIEDLFDNDLERHTWVFFLPYTLKYISYAL
jgi:hypothetical protein